MATFVYHGGHIIQRSGGIHKNEGGAALGQGAIVTTRGLAFTAFKIELAHCFHFPQAVAKKGIELIKTPDRFLCELFPCLEGTERLRSHRFSFYIPGAERIKTQFLLFSLI